MTLKEAILLSLEEINAITNYLAVLNHIVEKKYYDFRDQKTPGSTVSAALGDFIRNGDARIKRIWQPGGNYSYYLTKNEQNIEAEILDGSKEIPSTIKPEYIKPYHERDLHLLLSSYLRNSKIFSKTIFHEQSTYQKDNKQIWSHPDMVGIRITKMESLASKNLQRAINNNDLIRLYSYEIKKEIVTDSDLKMAFFQAVSNSSWANYGYLVAIEFNNGLMDEMERLSQAFGIGIIKLNANPFRSQVLFPPKFRNLDFRTVDKLCLINKEFETFIEQTEKLMNADEKYYKSTEKELNEFCDKYLLNDSESKEYCESKNIPFELDSYGNF